MRVQYDFSKGVRGKYAGRFASRTVRAVVLDEDVAKAYPTSKAVNSALREHQKLKAAKATGHRKAG
ncbi:MAG: hypothetical protein AMXMBFR58_15040 [Phycisphaerae bacterium]|nr:hypothetical protein [Phycisphaerales bacterium]MCK6477456.1 hypothetical protein [Phycisphaerales bacterium]